jgi:sporulation protein YlmC with PRC-barrel domain
VTSERPAVLVRLSQSGHTVTNPPQDVRGRTVKDRNGDDVGKVDDLLIDDQAHQVRMLRVTHGGILGFGASASFIPVEAITKITKDTVHINRLSVDVANAPPYDPELQDQTDYYGSMYGYYGYPPFGGAGYI